MIWAYSCVSGVRKALRCHDALVFMASQNTDLPSEVDGVSFRITNF